MAGSHQDLGNLIQELSKKYDADKAVQSVAFALYAEQYCKTNKIIQCIYKNKEVAITLELLEGYAKEVLGNGGGVEEEKSDKPPEKKAVVNSIYQQLSKSANIVNEKRMLQYHFADKVQAERFLIWVKNQNLPLIDQASIAEGGNKKYIILLSEGQHAILNGLKPSIPFALHDHSNAKLIEISEQLKDAKINKKGEKIYSLMKDLSEKDQAKLIKLQPDLLLIFGKRGKDYDSTFIALYDKLLPQILSDIVAVQNQYRWTALHSAGRSLYVDAFIVLVNKASSDAINQALVKQDIENWTALHMASRCQAADAFIALVNKASSDAINQALVMQNKESWTALHTAAYSQAADAFIALVNKASSDAINQALVMQSKENWTALYIASRHQAADAFIALVNKASSDAINQALVMQSKENWTALHIAAHYQAADAFIALVNKASSDAINQALVMRNNENWTALYIASRYQAADAFIALVNKASSDAINQALVVKSNENWTVLHMAVLHQSTEACTAVINKASSEAIDNALPKQADDGETSLHTAVRYAHSTVVSALIHKATSNALSAACMLASEADQSVLESALSYQPPAVIAELLNKVDLKALTFMLTREKIFSRLLAVIASYIAFEPSWQTERLLSNLFNIADPKLTELYPSLWLTGKDLPSAVMNAALPHLQKQTNFESKSIAKAWKESIAVSNEEKKEEKIETIKITTSIGTEILIDAVNKEEAMQKIWQEGLSCAEDYRILKKNLPDARVTQMVDDLHRADLLYIGCSASLDPNQYKDRPQTYQGIIQQGNVLLKIIKSENWGDQLKQFVDYKYRPTLRKETDKKLATHKFVHLTGTIVEHKFHDPAIKKKKYTHTKKQAATLLSSKLNTSVFGEHDPGRELVGLLFEYEDKKKVKTIIKAMLSADRGTYHRNWVGKKEEVEKHAAVMKEINYTDFTKFRQMVDQNPHRLNEVLAKFSRESLMAILIVTDTKKAREIAKKRHADIKAKCEIDLPIVFYDRALRSLREYTLHEQQDDLAGYSLIKLADIKVRPELADTKVRQEKEQIIEISKDLKAHYPKIKPAVDLIIRKISNDNYTQHHALAELKIIVGLLAIEKEINQKATWATLTIFGNKNIPPSSALFILAKIQEAECGTSSWAQAVSSIKAKLAKEKDAKLCPKEIQQLYRGFYSRLG